MTSPAETADRPFIISRRYAASPERLFQAWTEIEQLRQWWGPKGFELTASRIDLRPGGMFHYAMRMPNGQELWGRWVFREIQPPERLVFIAAFSDPAGGEAGNPWTPTWPLQTLSVLTFTAQDDGHTLVTMEGTPLDATPDENAAFTAAHGSMQQGWTGTLDQLETHLARP